LYPAQPQLQAHQGRIYERLFVRQAFVCLFGLLFFCGAAVNAQSPSMSGKRLIVGTDENYEPFGLYEQATMVDFDPPAATAGSNSSP
jgi:hypothetical protein